MQLDEIFKSIFQRIIADLYFQRQYGLVCLDTRSYFTTGVCTLQFSGEGIMYMLCYEFTKYYKL